MIAILRKGFISCLISSNNRNPQLISFQKIYTLLGILWNVWPWSNDYARLSFGVYWYLNQSCFWIFRFDFICAPICHPRYRREFLDPVPNRTGAFTRSDLVLPSQGNKATPGKGVSIVTYFIMEATMKQAMKVIIALILPFTQEWPCTETQKNKHN